MNYGNNNYFNPLFPQQYPQPQMPNYMQPQQQRKPLFYGDVVNGIEGAKAYQMQPNEKAFLVDQDTNSSLVYIKVVNELGQATVKPYLLTEYIDTPAQAPNYITRDEVDEMIKSAINARKSTKSGE